MQWTIDKGRIPDFLRVSTSGKPSLDGFVAMWDEILASDVWQPGMTVLMDNRKLRPVNDQSKFTAGAIDYFTENTSRVGKACIATLDEQNDNYKYARQFQYGVRLRGSDVVVQLFSSETKAVQWLDHYCKLQENAESSLAARPALH